MPPVSSTRHTLLSEHKPHITLILHLFSKRQSHTGQFLTQADHNPVSWCRSVMCTSLILPAYLDLPEGVSQQYRTPAPSIYSAPAAVFAAPTSSTPSGITEDPTSIQIISHNEEAALFDAVAMYIRLCGMEQKEVDEDGIPKDGKALQRALVAYLSTKGSKNVPDTPSHETLLNVSLVFLSS